MLWLGLFVFFCCWRSCEDDKNQVPRPAWKQIPATCGHLIHPSLRVRKKKKSEFSVSLEMLARNVSVPFAVSLNSKKDIFLNCSLFCKSVCASPAWTVVLRLRSVGQRTFGSGAGETRHGGAAEDAAAAPSKPDAPAPLYPPCTS